MILKPALWSVLFLDGVLASPLDPLGDAQWSCVLVLEHLVCKQSNISVHRKLSMTFLYRRTIGKLRLRLRSWYSKTPYNDIGFRHSDVIYGFLPRNFDHLSASRVGKTIASDGKDLAFLGQLLKFFSFLSFCTENRNNSDSPSARAPFPFFCPVDSRWLFYPNTWEKLLIALNQDKNYWTENIARGNP